MNFDEKIMQFSEIFFWWNKTHNISGAKDTNALEDLIKDCLYPLEFLPKFSKALDVGSGAGFPALIMALKLKNAHFTLLEPRQKRASFLNFVISSLNLENVQVVNKRIQEIPDSSFDLVSSKALFDAENMYKLAFRFLHSNSQILLFKGKNYEKKTNLELKIYENKRSKYLLIPKQRVLDV